MYAILFTLLSLSLASCKHVPLSFYTDLKSILDEEYLLKSRK